MHFFPYTLYSQFLYEHVQNWFKPGVSPSFLSAFIKYQNGKLEEGTRYAVFQRSFDADGDYENEGFTTFTTKETQDVGDDGISTTTVVLAIVVVLLVLVIVVGGIVVWRRLHPNGEF